MCKGVVYSTYSKLEFMHEIYAFGICYIYVYHIHMMVCYIYIYIYIYIILT